MKVSTLLMGLLATTLSLVSAAPSSIPYNTTDLAHNATLDKRRVYPYTRVTKCRGARIGQIEDFNDRQLMIENLVAYDGSSWHGMDIGVQRWLWMLKDKWEKSEDCWLMCQETCLLPAATYGFDAAFCYLINDGDFGVVQHQCAVGWTPDAASQCEPAGDDACVFSDVPWWGDEWSQNAWVLREAKGEPTRMENGRINTDIFWHKEDTYAGQNLWQDGRRLRDLPKFAPTAVVRYGPPVIDPDHGGDKKRDLLTVGNATETELDRNLVSLEGRSSGLDGSYAGWNGTGRRRGS